MNANLGPQDRSGLLVLLILGVDGLLKLLESVRQPARIDEYRRQTLAVDISSWLYKGAPCCCRLARDPHRSVRLCNAAG